MDFYKIKTKSPKKNEMVVYADFKVGKSNDLMVKGKNFYAIWDETTGLWSTDEFDVVRLVDMDIEKYAKDREMDSDGSVVPLYLSNYSSKAWREFKEYLSRMPNTSKQLDEKICFANTDVVKKDYISRKLPYPICEGSTEAYDKLVGTLYDEDEKRKIEWAIGSIISGDSKNIQKFLVLYGEAGAGKSTVLNIIQRLFEGYYTIFEAKELTSRTNGFAVEMFKHNPLVAIQHDGDLSRIEDNTLLNSIISHEEIVVNEKYKSKYSMRINCFLFMATNQPVRITDAKSGILRRLIDVSPTGKLLPVKEYDRLMDQINYELGAIAHKCLKVYEEMGKSYYNTYKPIRMMFKTNVFYNYVEQFYYEYLEEDGVSLKKAYSDYRNYCADTGIDSKLPMYKFREELKNYFQDYHQRLFVNGENKYSYFTGFLTKKFKEMAESEEPIDEIPEFLKLSGGYRSQLDKELLYLPAQYATEKETPEKKWSDVTTTLEDINTKELHYVKMPGKHIVIDFDLVDEDNNKSLEKNIEAAKKFPPTYAELSKSGQGLHLHYIYDGDVTELEKQVDDKIEIKVFRGNSALRRKLTKCNKYPIATISSGLPKKKGEKKVIDPGVIKTERGLRKMIERNLRKEIHPATKPSIDFIKKILDDAYEEGYPYDLTDMRPAIMAFANNSTNNSEYCVKLVTEMKFQSESEAAVIDSPDNKYDEIIFYDLEVFPNLFIICWKKRGKRNKVVKMINPKPSEVEELTKFKLVGFNNRRYDNHILWARILGFDNYHLYIQSQRIINNSPNAFFREAYNLSYADIYEFSSIKQSLKKFEIDLGIHHQELGLPWDQEVPEEKWELVADYCCNDVIATEATFEDREQDFVARLVLADLSGLRVNDTTQTHTAKIIFGDDPHPQEKFNYPDLSKTFKGYVYDHGVSTYKGYEVGEGGFVYAETGVHENVALLDVSSMHPTSLIQMNMFGPYTENFKALKDARIAIKQKDYDSAKNMLGGVFSKYLESENQAASLSYALKIVINMVYGFTSAKFENKFRDNRNIDNKVAKRGALFMVDLKEAVEKKGFKVVHIKTDSVKIPNATDEIISFVMDFGKKYGYEFEHEATYKKFCLINKADYIAQKQDDTWTATGDRFSQPYVFKTLFSKEKVVLEDMCETKAVQKGLLYLDFNENLPEDQHDYHFVGKVGQFCPIKPGCGGGVLYRENEGKYYAATGTKGYRWLESEVVRTLKRQNDIDESYYEVMVDDALKEIGKVGSYEALMSEDFMNPPEEPEPLPWDPN